MHHDFDAPGEAPTQVQWPRRHGCFLFMSPLRGYTMTPVASVAQQKEVCTACSALRVFSDGVG